MVNLLGYLFLEHGATVSDLLGVEFSRYGLPQTIFTRDSGYEPNNTHSLNQSNRSLGRELTRSGFFGQDNLTEQHPLTPDAELSLL